MKNIKIALSIFIAIVLLTGCQKDFSHEGDNLGPDQWQFRFFPTFYTGILTKSYISNNTLFIKGKSSDMTHDFRITLFSSDSTFTPGDYRASLQQADLEYSVGGSTTFQSGAGAQELHVRITLINDERVLGDFSGFVLDSSGNQLKLTQGKFNANLSKGP